MPSWLLIFLAIFATYRLAELISIDKIFQPVRSRIGEKVNPLKKDFWWWLAEWLNCPYCIGIWIALFLSLLIAHGLNIVLVWLAVAGGQSWLQSMADRNYEDR